MARRKTVAALVALIGVEGKEKTIYRILRIRGTKAVAGPVWRFIKGSGENYDVTADGENVTCECRGYLRWGHCRHIDCARDEGLI